MTVENDKAEQARQSSLPTKIDEHGRIVPVSVSHEKLRSDDTPIESTANSPEGQENIDYVDGIRFWLITSS